MLKIKSASGTVVFKEDFTETIQEMIDDGEITTIEEVKEMILEYLSEDLAGLVENTFKLNKITSFNIECE